MAKAKRTRPVKKAHLVTGFISLLVVIFFLWLINNVAPAKKAARKIGIKG